MKLINRKQQMLDLFALRCCLFGNSMIFDGDVCPFRRHTQSTKKLAESRFAFGKLMKIDFVKVAAMEPLSPDLDPISVFMTFHNFKMTQI